MGAQKASSSKQFLVESFLVNLFASLLAVLFVRLAWPSFSVLSGRNIPLDYLYHRDFWQLLIILFVSGAILSGFYQPLFCLLSKPVSVLKGKMFRNFRRGNGVGKSLVVFQF